uniref:Phosphoglycerate mutase-like protein 1 n=1 Tax=Glycine max TaxID=3847 RepID=Q8LGT7_SOYBN|nr:unknown [Glycine max]
MDTAAGQSPHPLHRCKTLHLVRHAQGFHNVEGEKNFEAYKSYDLFDANLTPLGWNQVDNLREHVKASGLSKKIELVIVSPLLRTMQTAVGVFGGEAYTDGINVPPLMNDNVGDSRRPAISSLNVPPFNSSRALPRTFWGVSLCKEKKHHCLPTYVSQLLIFHCYKTMPTFCGNPPIREKNCRSCCQGTEIFGNGCGHRKKKEKAVVTHRGFLFHSLRALGNDCHPNVKNEICTHFANCELRSMVIIDKGVIGSNESSTNYTGKIPYGRPCPSKRRCCPETSREWAGKLIVPCCLGGIFFIFMIPNYIYRFSRC